MHLPRLIGQEERKENKTMKKTANINKERGGRIMRQAILTLGLVTLLCMPYMTLPLYAQDNVNMYQGMAYLAEQEIRTQELQARAAEEAELVANAATTDEESTQNDK